MRIIFLILTLFLFGCTGVDSGSSLNLRMFVLADGTEIIPPPIPNLAKWESNMVQYATPLCNEAAINKSLGSRPDEGGVWYYDGTRIFQQIADYTANPDWQRCANYVAKAYQSYVIGQRTPGWRVFPEGLFFNYQRTNDALSSQAVKDLATISAFANSPSDPAWSDSWEYSREIAYINEAYIFNSLLGNGRHIQQAIALDDIFGHFNQWATTAPTVKPFMIALSAESLITHFDHINQDPRILPAIQGAADYLWANAWRPASRSFEYAICRGRKTRECAQGPAPDLNLLIAPMYGWLYRQTGDAKYQIQGDEIFSGGVDLAWLGSGKHFSQNYRWSFRYVEYRK